MWIETDSPAELVAHMRSQGVIVKQSGNMVVAKPALIMGQNQASELISALRKFA
jgi:adenosylmethionine-8-amino-7-oxononanoate aminotransferase